MNRIQRAAILTGLVNALRERGSWCGETHIQKAVFFSKNLQKCHSVFALCSMSTDHSRLSYVGN